MEDGERAWFPAVGLSMDEPLMGRKCDVRSG